MVDGKSCMECKLKYEAREKNLVAQVKGLRILLKELEFKVENLEYWKAEAIKYREIHREATALKLKGGAKK